AVTSSPVIGADGTIYVAAGGTLHALWPDGARKWSFAGGSTTNSSPTLASDGTIYFGAGSRLYAIRDSDFLGDKKWQFDATGSVLSSPAIASNGRIYFGASGDAAGGRLYVLSDSGTAATKIAEATTG